MNSWKKLPVYPPVLNTKAGLVCVIPQGIFGGAEVRASSLTRDKALSSVLRGYGLVFIRKDFGDGVELVRPIEKSVEVVGSRRAGPLTEQRS
ncbi:hypothetical protein OWV82_017450 [Melia azedarach]|uniref:Uncharacterized protein n=1 Tax=Melia azedarach TaxID=155640 RepID=A0ACC1XJL8_MELAZ|nr:hypothetical protein OWV82_017450 [Melia azedarach]